MAISMLKIRRPLGRLIFNMGIAIPGKTVFLIETDPWWFEMPSHLLWRHCNEPDSFVQLHVQKLNAPCSSGQIGGIIWSIFSAQCNVNEAEINEFKLTWGFTNNHQLDTAREMLIWWNFAAAREVKWNGLIIILMKFSSKWWYFHLKGC